MLGWDGWKERMKESIIIDHLSQSSKPAVNLAVFKYKRKVRAVFKTKRTLKQTIVKVKKTPGRLDMPCSMHGLCKGAY